ncbi:hypothetical protein CEXT_343971 [Caerostris extrusa]|uniref:Uncharacterized protein n=1 Tax=Caerostris extrusa TaxID=172846 RepID=A0AAV4VYL9_CAEEX|nr:hypothetical protein CEXT_343971 [Caerostris extrusa]
MIPFPDFGASHLRFADLDFKECEMLVYLFIPHRGNLLLRAGEFTKPRDSSGLNHETRCIDSGQLRDVTSLLIYEVIIISDVVCKSYI